MNLPRAAFSLKLTTKKKHIKRTLLGNKHDGMSKQEYSNRHQIGGWPSQFFIKNL